MESMSKILLRGLRAIMLTWWSMRNLLFGHEQVVPESTSKVLIFGVNIRLRASGVNNNILVCTSEIC